MLYALVKDGYIEQVRSLPTSWGNVSGLQHLDRSGLIELGWFEVEETIPSYDPATQRLDGPNDAVVGGTRVARTYTVVDLTPEEIEVKQASKDLDLIREATKDVALILTEVVPWLVANTPMAPTDFTPAVRQAYQDLKTLADRIRARM